MTSPSAVCYISLLPGIIGVALDDKNGCANGLHGDLAFIRRTEDVSRQAFMAIPCIASVHCLYRRSSLTSSHKCLDNGYGPLVPLNKYDVIRD